MESKCGKTSRDASQTVGKDYADYAKGIDLDLSEDKSSIEDLQLNSNNFNELNKNAIDSAVQNND